MTAGGSLKKGRSQGENIRVGDGRVDRIGAVFQKYPGIHLLLHHSCNDLGAPLFLLPCLSQFSGLLVPITSLALIKP